MREYSDDELIRIKSIILSSSTRRERKLSDQFPELLKYNDILHKLSVCKKTNLRTLQILLQLIDKFGFEIITCIKYYTNNLEKIVSVINILINPEVAYENERLIYYKASLFVIDELSILQHDFLNSSICDMLKIKEVLRDYANSRNIDLYDKQSFKYIAAYYFLIRDTLNNDLTILITFFDNFLLKKEIIFEEMHLNGIDFWENNQFILFLDDYISNCFNNQKRKNKQLIR